MRQTLPRSINASDYRRRQEAHSGAALPKFYNLTLIISIPPRGDV